MSYQGKFSKPRSTGETHSAKEALQQREASAPNKQAAAVMQASVPEAAPPAPKQEAPKEAAVIVTPSSQKQEVPKEASVAVAPPSQKQAFPKEAVAKVNSPEKSAEKQGKKKERTQISLFSCFVSIVLILAFVAGMFCLHEWVNNWLVSYDAAQPHVKSDEVFQQYFADPDWSALYDMSGIEGTVFEDKDTFLNAITEKVGESTLTYAETSTSIDRSHRYIVKLGNERIGYFTLVDNAEEDAAFPDWQTGEVGLFATYSGQILIQTGKENTVFVNGVELDESYVVRKSEPMAGNYLPEGVNAPIVFVYQVDDLMYEPQIAVTDETGTEVTVSYDDDAGMYIQQQEAPEIGSVEKKAAIKACELYARYLIGGATTTELARGFVADSQAYNAITAMSLWMEESDGYGFVNEEVSEYVAYSDELFSAKVSLTLSVAPVDGETKDYNLSTTLFFRNTGDEWMAYAMTNDDIQALESEVRVSFISDDTVLFTNFYEEMGTTHLLAPVVTPPEGLVFTGWYREIADESGEVILTLAFTPDEDGNIDLPDGTILEPMKLYAQFAEAGSTDGGNE